MAKINTGCLRNGIRLVQQTTDSPVAHFGLMLNAGSRDELPDEQGIAHFIEHVIFKGTTTRKAFHIISRMEDVGGELNAYTSKEETAIYSSFLTPHTARAMELISDIVANSIFPARELEREKEVIIEEIKSCMDNPQDMIFDDFDELLFSGHPIARNILGTPKLVRSFSREKALRFIAENYCTTEMVLSLAGNVPFERFQALAERYFGHMPEKRRPEERLKFSSYTPQTRRISKSTRQLHCILGNIACDAQSPNRTTMALLNNLLGGPAMSSRLNMSLREHHGLVYNVESTYIAFSDTGEFSISFGAAHNELENALHLIYKELNRLKTTKLGILQLSKAKKQFLGQLALANEDKDEVMLSMGRNFLLFNRIDDSEKILHDIEQITAEKLCEIANEIFDEQMFSMLIYE
ncbi:MAG: insulinase family protein [Bacteroidales bacterium]|jgi:predicted Zn-dependent peptidase|nr:insulinase family protein [Bacteroidales bacterium]